MIEVENLTFESLISSTTDPEMQKVYKLLSAAKEIFGRPSDAAAAMTVALCFLSTSMEIPESVLVQNISVGCGLFRKGMDQVKEKQSAARLS